jgi:predicted TIM-barrel fold metal-dependent hydrolase
LALATPHYTVREDWLALAHEEAIAPEQPILDAHHHLWDRPEGRYVAEDFLHDVGQGHDIRASLYVQCRTGYRADGPVELRPVGEVETILHWCRKRPEHPVGVIAFADLQLGDAVRPVLDAVIEAGDGRVCGIRNTTAYHPHPAVRSNARPAPDGLLRSDGFRTGASAVRDKGLCLDVWAYQTQLAEVCALARAVPDLTVVLDHCGGPLGVGPYRKGDPEAIRDWRNALARVAELPNTWIKIGGFGLSVMGYDYAQQPKPPHSRTLAADWAPYVETCTELFGSQRAMFESNFPVDKGQFTYRALWNAFKRLSADRDPEARDDLFWRSAARCYHVEEKHFSNDNGRKPK